MEHSGPPRISAAAYQRVMAPALALETRRAYLESTPWAMSRTGAW